MRKACGYEDIMLLLVYFYNDKISAAQCKKTSH